MGVFSAKTLAGPGYIILNILRAFNIITLLAIAAANMVLLAKIHMDTHFFFFEAVSHAITILLSFFLITSESGLLRAYFARCHPLLSAAHSFHFLGILLMALGVTTLGNLNHPAYTKDNMGLGFWRIVIGAGILAFVFGVFNILASFIFRQKSPRVTARMIRGKGAVALTAAIPQNPWDRLPPGSQAGSWQGSKPVSNAGSFHTASATQEDKKTKVPWKQRFSRFKPSAILPTYNEKANGARPNISRPLKSSSQESLVDMREAHSHSMAPQNGNPYDQRFGNQTVKKVPAAPSSVYSDPEERAERQRSMQISGPLNVNPQFAHLVPQFATMQRPDSTYHPARHVPGRYEA